MHSRLYQTGDYASVGKGGIIQYEGRTDSQVKIRGHRVDLSEIKKCLLEMNDIEEAIVLCYCVERLNQSILGFACIKSTSHMDELQVEKHIRDKLPEYMIPQVLIIDEMPLLVNGKIDRQTLFKMYETSINNENTMVVYDYTGVAENEMEKAGILFKMIGQVIKRSSRATISLKSNFFALGGNSLNSIYTIAKLRDRGYRIEVSDFLSGSNLRGILDAMREINSNQVQCIEPEVNESIFVAEPLRMEHKAEAIQ